MQASSLQLLRQGLGAIPILDQVIERIGLLGHLTEAMDQARYSEAILVLLKNILVERRALYAIREWSAQYDPALVYGGRHGDDVLARALDRLFETDRASLLTRVVLSSVQAYAVDLSQIHQDTTSVKVTGLYAQQQGRAVQLVRGHSKDHRPDLRQLVYELSVTRDGASRCSSKPTTATGPTTPCIGKTGRCCVACWAAPTSCTWPTPNCA